MTMARIQDIREFEDLISRTVDEYIQEIDCYESPVLAIWREEGELKVVIDEPSNLPLSDDMVQYPIDEVILNEVDSMTPNYDRISAIANEWIFIEH